MDLVSCYSQLATEAKRRDSGVREASEAAILALQQSPTDALNDLAHLSSSSPEGEESSAKNILLHPISLGCTSKNAKVVTLALNCLQRLLIASPARPALGPSAIGPVVQALRSVSNQGVESQLKILQVLPTLLSSASEHVHRSKLFDCLLLCFKLQESKVGVVSSTAAATLRQMVIILFEGVVEEDRRANDAEELHSLTLHPENTVVQLRPSALDAFDVLQDLCNLISSPPLPPNHLQLTSLPKTFGLELIESVLSDFPSLFYPASHPELHHLLKHSLSPLLMKSLAGDANSSPIFSVTLRLMRVIFLLLKGFSNELPSECQVRGACIKSMICFVLKLSYGQSSSSSDLLADVCQNHHPRRNRVPQPTAAWSAAWHHPACISFLRRPKSQLWPSFSLLNKRRIWCESALDARARTGNHSRALQRIQSFAPSFRQIR